MPRTNQGVTIPPGDDVHVKMEHVLPTRFPVRLKQSDTVGLETLPDQSGDSVRRLRHVGEGLLVDCPYVGGVQLRDDQRVAVTGGVAVEECQCAGVLVDDDGRRLAGHDCAEDAHHSSILSVPPPGEVQAIVTGSDRGE